VRGFIRSYAKLLELDPLPLLERFQQRAPAEDHALSAASQQIELPVGVGKRRYIYVAIAALLAIAAPIAVYEALHGQQGGAQPVGAFVAPSQAPRPVVVQPAAPPEAAARPLEQPAEALPLAMPLLPPPAPVTVPETSRPVPVVPQALPPAAPALEAGKRAREAAAAKASGIKLVFAGDSWVEITDGRGKIIFSELSPGGSERQIDGVPPFSLVVGNATRVRIAYNGEQVDLAPYTRGDVAHLTFK
jgi:cytoskeleton protein RodZ